MSVVEIEGTYEHGRVKLSREPREVRGPSRVVVTFLDAEGPDAAEETRLAAAERMLVRMRKGIDFGGPPYSTREEIYEERTRRVTERPD